MPGSSRHREPAEAPGSAALATRLLLVYGVLIWLTYRFGRDFIDLLLPAFSKLIGMLDDHYRILLLETGTEGADTVVRLEVTLAKPIFLNGHLIMPHAKALATATTTIGTILQIPLVSLGLILAWPVRRAVEHLPRLGIALLLILPVLLFDTPLILWASLWDLHVHAIEPDRFSPLLIWQRFLISGGRLAISIALGITTIALAKRYAGASRRFRFTNP